MPGMIMSSAVGRVAIAGGAKPGETDQENANQFYGVSLNALFTDAILACQIYLKMGPSTFVKYREPGIPFTGEVRTRLRENRHTHIFVQAGEGAGLNSYLEANMKTVIADPKFNLTKKAEVLYATTTHLIRELLNQPSSSDELRRVKRVVESCAELILSQPRVLGSIIDAISIDYYTYTHSVNVMTYSIALAKCFGYPEGQELLDVAQAALLHDIGKQRVDPKITNKDGPLTEDEFEQMKQHPSLGFGSLKKSGEIEEQVLNSVLHHHEKLDGNGYPDGLSDGDIDLTVRVVTCADIYDALTTRRVYRKAYRSFPALRMMKETLSFHLDERVFREFVRMLGEV